MAFPLLGVGQDRVQDELVNYLSVDRDHDEFERLLALAARYAAFIDLDQRYDAIYKARKTAKQSLAAAKAELGATGELATPDRDKLTKAEDQLASLREKKEELVERRGALAQSAGQRARLDQEIAAVAAELKEIHAAASKDAVPDPEHARDMERQLHEKELQISGMKIESSELTGELRALDSAIAAFGGKNADCPLATGVPCGMTADARKSLVADLKKSQKAKAANHGSLQDLIKDAERELAEMNEHLKTLSDTAEVVTRNAGLRERLTARLESLQAARAELLEPLASTDSLEAAIGALAARMTAGEAMIVGLRDKVALADRQRDLRAQVEQLEQDAADYEILVEAFGPKGFRANLLDSGIGPLTARVNENLALLTRGEYQVEIEVAPDFRILVEHAGIRTELKHLSASERVRVGLALTEALVHASGLGVLVLDGAEILDAPNRNRLISFLVNRQDDHETIVVLTTTERETLRPNDLMKVFWVEGGRVEAVEAVGVGA